MIKAIAIASASLMGTQGVGDTMPQPTIVYSEQLDAFDYGNGNGNAGFYSQDWSAMVIGTSDIGEKVIYVEGQGKSGTFHGLLELNCTDPEASRWLASSAYLRADQVPIEAILGVRNLAC